ncbi:LCP family protein [Patescibacteria group bacterium]|nr:LCP family protein [Patescibacteria group bacterium]
MSKKLSSWRRKQIQDNKKTKLRITKLVFIIIIIIILSGLSFKIFRSVGKSLWDGKGQFNLVINSQPVMVVSFDYPEKNINLLSIPDGTFVEAIHGYGPYRIESLYKLGEIKGNGGGLLAGSLQEYFGINLEGYLTGDKYQPDNMKIKNFLLNQFFDALRGRGKTNLSRWDLLRIWWQVKKIREDKIIVVDLAQTSASQEVDLPDGSKAIKIEPERLTRIISQFFIDEEFKKEDLTITVLNKTEHLGLANNASKIINNIGGRVIQISSLHDQTGTNGSCEIKSEKKYKNSYTVEKLKQIFDCHWSEGEENEQRARILLLVGEDYWARLNLP